MPDPRSLKVGDYVRFVDIPDEWNEPQHRAPRDTLAFMKVMIRRTWPSRISEVDKDGWPSIRARIWQRGKLYYHWYLITETTGWRKVRPRKRPDSTNKSN